MKGRITQRKNERSWAIEIISQINAFADGNDLRIKRAGGENTISTGNQRMFPDVLLYGDKELTVILQGWELKMPDVPITDDAFVKDAWRKASALGLNSCVIWNFTSAKLYILNPSTKSFEVARTWENPDIKSRPDVAYYLNEWKETLEDVVLTVNDYLINHKVKSSSIEEIVSDKAIKILIDNNKTIVAENLKEESVKDSYIKAYIDQWWKDIKAEYLLDETDNFKAYAKNIIINWSYRIIFAHLIKTHQQEAMAINSLDYDYTPKEANEMFEEITSKCDFYNVFDKPEFSELLPDSTWHSLIELSAFLKANGISSINQSLLQNILDGSINTTHREMNGQFTTPNILARILACITIRDWTDNTADTCCGTGTIPHAIIDLKKSKIGASKAVETTWASDKYQMPLQIANISMTSYDTINMACRLFKKNVFELKPGDKIELINPADGGKLQVEIPLFGAICSNLPFVQFKNISATDIPFVSQIIRAYKLDRKSDLCYSIALHLSGLLKNKGYLGIITSNAWLGTAAGNKFYHALTKAYDIMQVHISGDGRWFKNADVVTTIILLRKKGNSAESSSPVQFFLWKKTLEYIDANREAEEAIIRSSLLGKVTDDNVLDMSSYTQEQIEELHNLNILYNALFHDVSWVLDIKDKLIPLSKIFSVIRGSRRGWDKMFYPEDSNSIERDFLYPILVNATNVDSLNASPDREAFCCSLPMETLQRSYPGAYSWIERFSTQKNGKGIPIPQILRRANMQWYELQPKEFAELFTMLNPDRRIFFGKFDKPTFISQRLIGLNFNDDNTDKELCHALLNTVLMQFFVESTGFGRGQGVLDMSKNHLANCFMLNPAKLSATESEDIKKAFKAVAGKRIMNVEDNLKDREWQVFNHTVLQSFGIDDYYDRICASLMSQQKNRHSANKKSKK